MNRPDPEPTRHRRWQEILLNRRMLICLFQGFASGMPLYVLIQLIPGWLRTEGVDLATIGLFSIVTLPYTWKFIWAPLVDRYRLPFLSRRRGWMLLTQVLLFASITQFAAVDPTTSLTAVVWLVFATSLFSATQDIVLDAYRREMLADDELGTGNSLFINAFRASSLVPGSLAFVLADHLSWGAVYAVVGAFMTIGIVTTLLVPETSDERVAPRSIRDAVLEPFVEFFGRGTLRSAALILVFMVLYRLGDNMAVALQTPFFIDLGFTLTQIGTIAKFAILGSAILGTALGGLLMLKLSINQALWIFGFVQMASSLGFAALARIGDNPYALFVAASFDNIAVGLGTVAITAFIAKQTNLRFTATQLALLTGLTLLPRTFANATTGFIIEAVGYFNFYLICAAVAIPGMLLLLVVAPWSKGEAPGQQSFAADVPQKAQS
jgi:PAT family beta-lactamase induction signal transducer AmpG